MKRLQVTPVNMARSCFVLATISFCFMFLFLMGCDPAPFAGVVTDYSHNSAPMALRGGVNGNLNLTATCNAGCQCSVEPFSPVCGADNVMYFR